MLSRSGRKGGQQGSARRRPSAPPSLRAPRGTGTTVRPRDGPRERIFRWPRRGPPRTLEGMFLENLGIDAMDPIRLGRFWEAALGTTTLTEAPGIFETRLDLDGTAYLDLCFAQVPAPNRSPQRLHLELRGGEQQAEVAERLRGLGASDLDSGQGEVPWTVLADVEGGAFCVIEEREAYAGTGPLAALPLDSADPVRDAEFWSWLSGWVPADGGVPQPLRHPSGRGPRLELVPEP